MLNGIDPIILFQFFKTVETYENLVAKIPVATGTKKQLTLPPIPIYLSEKLTGLYIDSEDKNVDIDTTPETLSDGEDPVVKQKGLNSTIRVNIVANKDSIGLMLLSAVADLIFPKASTSEYSITYLHGPVVIFNGLLNTFAVSQNADSTLMNVTLEISKASTKTEKKPENPTVNRLQTSATLAEGAGAPPPTAPIPGSAIQAPPASPPSATPVIHNGPG
jgi:hypothetical protein